MRHGFHHLGGQMVGTFLRLPRYWRIERCSANSNPTAYVNGAPVAEGSPIKDYFPAIVSENCSIARKTRGMNAASKERVAREPISAICFLASGKMRLLQIKYEIREQRRTERWHLSQYVTQPNADLDCEKRGWRYDQLEASFLAFVKELDLESLVRSESDSSRRTDLDNGIAALRGKLASLEEQRERTFELFAKSGLAADFVAQKLQELERERLQVVNSLAEKERERDELSSDLSAFYESKEQLKALLDRLQQSEGEDVYKLRAQISSRLKSLVSEIFVAPLGSAPMMSKRNYSQGKTDCGGRRAS